MVNGLDKEAIRDGIRDGLSDVTNDLQQKVPFRKRQNLSLQKF